MERIREILRRRTPELRGFLAPQSDIDRLASLTTATRFAEIVEVYREFPVCGMTLQFVVDKVGCTNPPGPLFMDPYDPETEFEFTWISPKHLTEEICNTYAGPEVFAAGFLPIGLCPMGGDSYYLGFRPVDAERMALFRVYYDWVDPTSTSPVPPDALNLIALSFAQVLNAARFDEGLRPIG